MSLFSTIRGLLPLELVETNLSDLGSCATLVVPELGGEGE
jgi:hypothetical protein